MNAEDYIDNYEDVMAQLTAIDFKKYCQDFIHKQIEVQNELLNKGSYKTFSKYFANNKEFVSKFKDCTFRFRKYIIKCSPKDTSQNLICHSIKKKSIDDYALMFYPDLKFEQFLYKKSWIKYSFSEQNLYKLIFVQLIMQAYHAGEKKIHKVQIIMGVIKIIIEKFHPNHVPWDYLMNLINYIVSIIKMEDIIKGIKILKGEPLKKRPSFDNGYNSKIKKLDIEEIKSLLRDNSLSRNEIKEFIADKYNVSKRLVTQFMSRNGLTRNYKKS